MKRDPSITPEWLRKIRGAQRITHYGETPRIRYGAETRYGDDWASTCLDACSDCGVSKGELHVPSCDREECPACGGQRLLCEAFEECGRGAFKIVDGVVVECEKLEHGEKS